MRVIDRYLVRGFIYPFFYCVILFTMLFIVIDGFNELDEFLKHGISLKIIGSYYLYSLPAILVNVVPVSVLVALLYKLGNLNKHNEIVALKASGVSGFHLLMPYLFVGLFMSGAVFLLSETLLPPATLTSAAIKEGLIQKGKKNLKERAIKNVTLYSSNNRMIFASEYQVLSQTLRDLVVLESGPEKWVLSKLIAKKAHYEDGRWVLYDAMKYRLNHRGEMVGEPSFFDRTDLDIPEGPQEFVKSASEVDFMSASQLKQYIENFKGGSKKMTRRLKVDFHYKIAFPFVSLVVMLIGAPLAMRIERGSALVGIGTSLLVVIAYYSLNSICLAMGKGGFLQPETAAWLSNAIFSLAGIYLIAKTP